jgi:hypothetical protein
MTQAPTAPRDELSTRATGAGQGAKLKNYDPAGDLDAERASPCFDLAVKFALESNHLSRKLPPALAHLTTRLFSTSVVAADFHAV